MAIYGIIIIKANMYHNNIAVTEIGPTLHGLSIHLMQPVNVTCVGLFLKRRGLHLENYNTHVIKVLQIYSVLSIEQKEVLI